MKVFVLTEEEAYALAEAITYKAQFTREEHKKCLMNNVMDSLTDERSVKRYDLLVDTLKSHPSEDGYEWLSELGEVDINGE